MAQHSADKMQKSLGTKPKLLLILINISSAINYCSILPEPSFNTIEAASGLPVQKW